MNISSTCDGIDNINIYTSSSSEGDVGLNMKLLLNDIEQLREEEEEDRVCDLSVRVRRVNSMSRTESEVLIDVPYLTDSESEVLSSDVLLSDSSDSGKFDTWESTRGI